MHVGGGDILALEGHPMVPNMAQLQPKVLALRFIWGVRIQAIFHPMHQKNGEWNMSFHTQVGLGMPHHQQWSINIHAFGPARNHIGY